jgi:hypothetical protein
MSKALSVGCYVASDILGLTLSMIRHVATNAIKGV